MKKILIWIVCLLAVFLVFVLVSLLPALMSARHCVRAAVCTSNLKQLGLACTMYSSNYDGHYPDNLAQLYPDYVKDIKTFFCPSDPDSRQPQDFKSPEDANMSYTLTPGLSPQDDPNLVLICDKSIWNHKSCKHVCFIDGHVEWVPIDKIIKKDFDEVAASLSSFFGNNGKYPTNEEGLQILVSSDYIRTIPVDPFDPEGKRPYGYATGTTRNSWILTCFGPDNDRDIDLSLYAQDKLSAEDLLKQKTKLILGMMTIKRPNGDLFRIGP